MKTDLAEVEAMQSTAAWPLSTMRVDFCISFPKGADLPHWKGSLLRGVLGHGLQSLGAAAPCPPWPGLVAGCTLQDALFEPQKAWASPRATVPWTLRCIDDQCVYSQQECLKGTFLLFGAWPEWCMASLQDAFEAGLQLGLGAKRHPARLASWELSPLTLQADLPGKVLTITTLTPARLRSANTDCTSLQAGVISRSLLRRADQLCRQMTGTRWIDDAQYPTCAVYGDHLETLAVSDDHTLIARWSNRQDRTVVMDAVAGSISLGGQYLPACWPWLRLAPILNLGKQPNLGLGICELSF